MTTTTARAEAGPAAAMGRYRWVVVALLFTAMVINYVDRQTIGLLKGDLSKEFGWDETNYADLVFWFQAAYAVSYLAFGRIVDRIGARWGFGLAFGQGACGSVEITDRFGALNARSISTALPCAESARASAIAA